VEKKTEEMSGTEVSEWSVSTVYKPRKEGARRRVFGRQVSQKQGT